MTGGDWSRAERAREPFLGQVRVEKLHEPIAAQPLSAQSSSVTLNVLMLHVVHHVLLLVSSLY